MTDTTTQPTAQPSEAGDHEAKSQARVEAQSSAATEQTHGQLVIIGRAEDREGDCTFYGNLFAVQAA
ncbi:hypothetical protein [Leptodesmis sp.]|uniref:hypothetical protein n=1 Tax=Leptodesmis sp. TaxID=3100501 RepID=UPI0040535600